MSWAVELHLKKNYSESKCLDLLCAGSSNGQAISLEMSSCFSKEKQFLNGQHKAGWVNTCQKELNKTFIHHVSSILLGFDERMHAVDFLGFTGTRPFRW